MLLPLNVRRLLAAPLIGGLATLVVPVLDAAPATASSTYLCTGFTGCAAAGYGSDGYNNHISTMWWRMYAGHNCTNYVAYRMIQAGLSTERPWSGSGMARNWGPANPSITDQTPAVGAVAWFARGLSGGVDGHVAYVEKVISPTQIVISEDMYNGDFHWATMNKDGGTWPSGFIHFADHRTPPAPQDLKDTVAPRIAGSAVRVGVPLTAAPGTWKPTGATFAYQWLSDGVAVTGATASTFTPTAAQVGHALSVQVTATKSGYVSATAVSPATADVDPGVLAVSAVPTLTGDAVVGQVLTATAGTVTPTPSNRFWRWRADGKVLTRAHDATLTLTPDLAGKTITIQDVARRSGYAEAISSAAAPVGPVVAGVIELPQPFHAYGQSRYGSTLGLTGGTVTPADADVAVTWLRDGVVVPGADTTTYPVGAADVGHHIDARVTYSKKNYADVVRHYSFGDTITTVPEVRVKANPKKDAAMVIVHVVAPGVAAATGPVAVSIGEHAVQGNLVDGRLRILVPDLKPGVRYIKVAYAAAGAVEAGHGSASVKVRH